MKTLFIKNRKQDIFLAFILTLFIITLAITFTVFFKQLYYFDIDYLNIAEISGLSKDIIKNNYDILIQYQSIFYRGALNFKDFAMSTTGRIHFEEVKRIFDMIQLICLGSGLISLIMIYHNIKNKEYRYLRLTSIFSIVIPSILGFLASLDFNQAFIIFHKLFFRNDYWIFDSSSDPIITILPEAFFMHCFIMIVVLIILMSIVCYFIYRKKEQDILKH
ncbi:MAG: TIGR01906 family membrane protein [Coprobacillus sp.]|nr:TIGR01906 family membrane protein [Coprobacillus sp.]